MISWMYVHIRRNGWACAALFALVACRLLQMMALARSVHAAESLFDSYLSINSVDLAAFLFVPLFCIGQMRSLKLYSSPQCALALGSRARAMLRMGVDCVLTGMFMAALLHASSYLVLLGRFGSVPVWEAFRPVDLVLQGIVLSNSGIIAFLVMMMFRSSAFACLAGFLYGMWDFMAMNIVGGGLPAIGWSLAIIPDGAGWQTIAVHTGAIASLLLVLGVLLWIVVGKVDYLGYDKCLSKA